MGKRGASRSRPAVFRALGRNEPPETIRLGGEAFRRIEILKHDSWAATAIYRSATRKALCKFNREQSIFGVPMRWLGRLLAAREQRFMQLLAGVEGIPRSLGMVVADGRRLTNAVSREYIDGHALAEGEWVGDEFFPRLVDILTRVHRRGVAHVDLHKRENILVGVDGRPHLIDYQISFAAPQGSLAGLLLGGLLRMLQRCDDYHLLKHRCKHRPDQVGMPIAALHDMRPWWIRLHRYVAVPFRKFRRGLLTALGIRARDGQASSEAFPEIAHRRGSAA